MHSYILIIAGGTGLIGSELVCKANAKGYEIVIISRDKDKIKKVFKEEYEVWGWGDELVEQLQKCKARNYAIVNLAGSNISEGKWNKRRKEDIMRSRIKAGNNLVEAIKGSGFGPKVFIQASAIGYYGNKGDEILTEDSIKGDGFLAEVADRWEDSTKEIIKIGLKHAIIRTSVVLTEEGGMLKKLSVPFKYYFGNIPGNGKQWFSWIHLEDEINAILHLLENELEGVFNLAAPKPILMEKLCKTLGKALNKPCWFKIHPMLLRLMFGEMANELLLTSQRVIPKRLIEAGFKFKYETIEDALQNIKL